MEVLILDSSFEAAKQKRQIVIDLGYKAKIVSFSFDFALAKKGDHLLIDEKISQKADIDVIIDEARKNGLVITVLAKDFPVSKENLKKVLNI